MKKRARDTFIFIIGDASNRSLARSVRSAAAERGRKEMRKEAAEDGKEAPKETSRRINTHERRGARGQGKKERQRERERERMEGRRRVRRHVRYTRLTIAAGYTRAFLPVCEISFCRGLCRRTPTGRARAYVCFGYLAACISERASEPPLAPSRRA